jgi:hypothetical protein
MQIAGGASALIQGAAPVSAGRAATSTGARRSTAASSRCRRAPAPRRRDPELPEPLVWTFDGPFERCLADLEDTLRRAIVMVGGVSRVALLIDLSLPALQKRVAAGDRLQPGWGRFQERIAGYGPAVAAAGAAAEERRPAGDARDRLPQLIPPSTFPRRLPSCRSRTGSSTACTG